MEFDINVQAILTWLAAFGYTALKVVSSIWITRKEFQYPIWNREDEQIVRGLPHKVRALIRNFTVNPEWAVLKLVAFLPVALFTGMKYWYTFAPWHVQPCPPRCKRCRDKGEYLVPDFHNKGHKQLLKCDCQSEQSQVKKHIYICMLCKDEHNIGPNRPCPRCADHHSRIAYYCWTCGDRVGDRTQPCPRCQSNLTRGISNTWNPEIIRNDNDDYNIPSPKKCGHMNIKTRYDNKCQRCGTPAPQGCRDGFCRECWNKIIGRMP